MRRPSPLRVRRLLRGARLLDVARATGLPLVYVSQVERGDRPLAGRVLHALARHYQTSADRLVSEMRRWTDPESAPRPAGGPAAA